VTQARHESFCSVRVLNPGPPEQEAAVILSVLGSISSGGNISIDCFVVFIYSLFKDVGGRPNDVMVNCHSHVIF
jgi:hypothetical protein